jgi:glycosyltransferase involved in cell wall biosynthesis
LKLSAAGRGTKLPTVSVVIPAYNQARFLAGALESVLTQTYPALEIVVVDDGSTDATGEVLAGFRGRVAVVRQPNNGVSSARNAGVAGSAGDLVAFLDADDQWLPDKLARQIARHVREPDLGLVHCGIQEIDADGRALGVRTEGIEGRVAGRLLRFDGAAILGGGSAALIPRTVFDRVGGFDPLLSTSADWDLYYRIAKDHPIGFVDEVLVRYRLHGAGMHTNVDLMAQDMLRAFSRAFASELPADAPEARVAYANLHYVLAGSYFVAGRPWKFGEHAARALVRSPAVLPRFLAFPARRLRRGVKTGAW